MFATVRHSPLVGIVASVFRLTWALLRQSAATLGKQLGRQRPPSLWSWCVDSKRRVWQWLR